MDLFGDDIRQIRADLEVAFAELGLSIEPGDKYGVPSNVVRLHYAPDEWFATEHDLDNLAARVLLQRQ